MKRLMEYKIISGKVVEIRRSWMSTDRSYKKPRGNRKAGNTSEKKIKANEKDAIRRLARILNCNFRAGDAFVTLKYDAGHEQTDYDTAEKVLSRYLRKLRAAYRKRTGLSLKAIWVTANFSPKRQAPARLHHHLVLPEGAGELARVIWTEFGGAGTYMLESMKDGDYSPMAAYLVENVHDLPAGRKKYSCSRGMEQPIYTEPTEVYDVEGVQAIPGSVVMDVEENQDEDGRVTSKYLRCRLDKAPKVRGGQIVLPRRRA